VVVKGSPLPRVDAHLPLLSLPYRLGVTLADLSDAGAYLRVEGQSQLPGDPRPSVGIVWTGSRTHVNDANRSCSPADFGPVLEIDGIRFVSLQKGCSLDASELPGLVNAAGLIS